MIIRFFFSKVVYVKLVCENLLFKIKVIIRELVYVIGLFVLSFFGVQFGCFYYRQLEKDKLWVLQFCKGNYDGLVIFFNDFWFELQWWVNNIIFLFMFIIQDKFDFIFIIDVLKIGWGVVCGDYKIGGCWDLDEQ